MSSTSPPSAPRPDSVDPEPTPSEPAAFEDSIRRLGQIVERLVTMAKRSVMTVPGHKGVADAVYGANEKLREIVLIAYESGGLG